jgi:hypothetical protein
MTTKHSGSSSSNLIFTVAGKNKDVKIFNQWISRITKSLNLVEAIAVILTNPALLEKIEEEFTGIKVIFSHNGIRGCINCNS